MGTDIIQLTRSHDGNQKQEKKGTQNQTNAYVRIAHIQIVQIKMWENMAIYDSKICRWRHEQMP